MIKLSVLSLLCVAPALLAQGEQTLRANAKKGSSVWLLQEQKQEQLIDQGGQQMEMGNSTTHTLHVSVLDVDDKGVMTVETEIARIHGSMQMGPMGETEFDSAAPDEDDEGGNPFSAAGMVKMLTKSAGKKFTAKVDPRGKALSIEGADELLKAGGGRMGQTITEGSLKQMVESAFGMLPEQPVAPGASWDHVQKESGGRMPAEHKLKLTLAKIDDASFEITGTGTIEKPPAKDDGDDDKDPMAAMMKNMTIENGKISGTQRVSRQDGFVIDATNTMSMDVEVDTGMGTMSMSIKQTMTTKRTTAEAAMPKKAATTPAPAKDEPKEGGE